MAGSGAVQPEPEPAALTHQPCLNVRSWDLEGVGGVFWSHCAFAEAASLRSILTAFSQPSAAFFDIFFYSSE